MRNHTYLSYLKLIYLVLFILTFFLVVQVVNAKQVDIPKDEQKRLEHFKNYIGEYFTQGNYNYDKLFDYILVLTAKIKSDSIAIPLSKSDDSFFNSFFSLDYIPTHDYDEKQKVQINSSRLEERTSYILSGYLNLLELYKSNKLWFETSYLLHNMGRISFLTTASLPNGYFFGASYSILDSKIRLKSLTQAFGAFSKIAEKENVQHMSMSRFQRRLAEEMSIDLAKSITLAEYYKQTVRDMFSLLKQPDISDRTKLYIISHISKWVQLFETLPYEYSSILSSYYHNHPNPLIKILSEEALTFMDYDLNQSNVDKETLPSSLFAPSEFSTICKKIESKTLIEIDNILRLCQEEKDWLLIYASLKGNADIVKSMLSKGAIIEPSHTAKRYALSFAVRNGYLEITQYLLDQGANVNLADIHNDIPIEPAVISGNYDLAKLLIEHGANVNVNQITKLGENSIRISRNTTPLMAAASSGYINIAKLLLENGAEDRVVDDDHTTAFTEALDNGQIEIANILIQHGADVNKKQAGKTPIERAKAIGNEKLVEFLKTNGAKENSQN